MHHPLLFVVTLATMFGFAQSAEVTVAKSSDQLRFTTAGQLICAYQMEAGEVPEGVDSVFKHGAHLHPIHSPSGKLVTGNHPEDHRWHRGVWFAWTKTEFGTSHPDFWNMGKVGEKLAAEVRFDKLIQSTPNSFTSRHTFLDHSVNSDSKVLTETWEVSVAQKALDGTLTNLIDLTSTQTCATERPLKLPTYHYGGLGLRGNLVWNPVADVTMLTSEGHDRKSGDST